MKNHELEFTKKIFAELFQTESTGSVGCYIETQISAERKLADTNVSAERNVTDINMSAERKTADSNVSAERKIADTTVSAGLREIADTNVSARRETIARREIITTCLCGMVPN